MRPLVTRLAAVAFSLAFLAAVYNVARESDEEKIREAIGGFADAVKSRKYAAVCSEHISVRLKESLELLGECPEVIERSAQAPSIDLDFELSVDDVDVDGEQATARVRSRTERGERDTELHMAKEGDTWRLDSF